MTRLLPLLAIMALFLGLVSVAHAQATTATVSTVAVTSDPGSDNTYTTLDVITVGVTFSEAVTVTGTPQITLDIGGTERTADYSGAGTATGQLLFSYTVQPVDQDDDGVAVVANSLTLNGGTIQSADDSTSATLTHSAMAFPSHKVDTELVLISNMGQADGTALRINAGETVRLSFDYWNSIVIYDLNQIVLDVKTPSDTLNLSITTVLNTDIDTQGELVATFAGSVATAGKQPFRSSNFTFISITDSGGIAHIVDGYVEVNLTATGSGFVELGTTASTAEDTAGAYRWSIADRVYKSTDGGTTYTEQTSAHIPRFSVVGHTTETLRVLAADVVSEPYNGTAYAAGEHIEVRIILNGPVRALADPLTVPLQLGEGAQHRHDARLVDISGRYTQHNLSRFDPRLRQYVLYFAYTVQPGDVDPDGVVLGADPLGTESDRRIEYALDSRVRMDLSFPAQGPSASHRVDGAETSACSVVHCAYLTAAIDASYPNDGGYFGPPEFGQITGNISGRLFSYGGQEYFFRLNVVEFTPSTDGGAGDSKIFILFTQPLQERPVLRLGWQVGDTAFAFADAETFLFDAPTSEEEGFEHRARYLWSTTGLRWNSGDRVLIKIVEMPVTATFDAASYAADEGGSVEVTGTLGGSFETKTVTLPIRAAGSGGATAADYSGVPANLVFAPGDTEKSFTVTLTDDDVDDDDESLTLSFGAESNIKSGGANETATVAIRDDDDPEVTVSFGAATYTAAEGSTATVTVTLSADPERTVAIPVTKANEGGASDSDYSGVPATVTFNAGDTSKTFTFTAVQDTVDDDDESVKLGFGSSLPAGVSEGSPSETTVSITDDDDPAVTVSFGAATYTAAEGGTATVTVTLTADPERTVEVPITTTNQGGASAADYSGVPASVTFDSGDTSKTFDFAATADTADDDGESVKLAFGALPTGVRAGATDETMVSITDDDDPAVTVSFGAATYRAAEGGTATVTVELSADPERTVAVPITKTNERGVSDSDYSGVPASITFNSGDTEKTITFTAVQDSLNESGERVKLSFGTLPAGVSEGTPAETTVTISDSTQAQTTLPTIHFGSASYTVSEGGSVDVTVTLSKAPGSEAVIPLTASNQGGATASDYSGVPTSVTFGAAETSKTFTVTAAQDTVDDDGESVLLGFGTLPGGITATTGEANETTVSIRDDDDPQVTVSFGAATYTAAEGGTATVMVTLSADPERTVEVQITTTNQGGATSADYSGVPTSVTFDAGDTSKTFDFAATQDAEDDDGESVKLAFGALPTGVTAGATDETTVSIRDDDDPQVTVGFGAATHTAAEGGTATVTVTLSADPERTVEVQITTTNQGGASASDYSGVPASVTFNAGETSKTITFSATQDTLDDDGESVKLGFGTSLPAGVSAGSPSETTVSITDDDDPAVTVSFGASTYTAAEGGTATVTVTLSADPERTVEVQITTTNQGGATSADYSGVPATVTFDAGDTSKTFDFAATADTVDDDGESVDLGFGSSLPTGVSEGSPSETTVSITDDDDPAVTVSFGASTYTAAEGGTATVTVTLSADPERTVEVQITTTNQGGATSADYSGVPTSVTFDAGDTSKTFDFAATQDAEDDDGESVKLAFGALPTGVRAGATDETSVSISDDDDPAVTVSFGAATYTAAEGDSATVTVTLSADPERTVAVPVTKTNQGGAVAADYSGVPATVTFNSGDTSKTFTFTATQDMGDDDGESVKLAFGTLPAGVSEGSPSVTTVTIRQVSTEFILSCGLAVWCADMRFSDGTAVDWGWSRLRYEKDWDQPATVSDDTFTFRGVEYTLRRVDVHPGTYPIMPNAWSRTKQGYSYISLRITRGDYWDPPPREHYRDWVLHLDGLELPFKDAFRAGDEFQWIGVAFQELFNDWISSTVTKIGIEEVAATAQEPTPVLPYAPIAVEAWASGRDGLYVRWDPPW